MGGRGVAVAVAVVVAAWAVDASSVGGWRAEAGWAGNDTRLLESHAHSTPPSLRQNPPITPLDPDSHALKVLTIPRQDRYTQGSHGAGGGAPSKTPPREAEEWGLGRGRGRWQGRRVVPDYETLEEEVLQGVDSGDPHAMLPDPTGAAVAVLARRLHHAAIRHRNGRRHFIRTRKAPKTRPRIQPDEAAAAAAGGEALQITWQHSALRHQEEEEWGEEEGEEEDGGEEQLHEESEIIEATSSSLPWSSGAPNLENKFRAMGDLVPTGLAGTEEGGEGGGGEQDAWGGQEEADVDVVTKFLRIVESQHLLGENCTKGTDFHLGEGVVDRYAQERFRLEGEIAVNRANLYTRLWKYSPSQVLASEYLLHAEVLTMVELDEDIFAAGNCYDKFEYEDYLLYCPFAYRLPEGNILVKDLAVEYKYLSNTSEWFFIARKNAERAINNYTHITKGYHTYTWNNTAHTARVEEEILSVTYEDGRWSKPYFDCGGGNIWMMTYTVPFFGYSNGSYYFKGTSGIDIDLRRVDIDQCPLPPGSSALNIFANSDKCKKKTTKCVTIPGLGFRRGSYRCDCRVGFYFPDTSSLRKYFNGSVIEEEYEKKIMGEFSTYEEEGSFECLPCAEGCESCEDGSPCVVSLNWVMRAAILTLSIIIILCLPIVVFFTWKFGNVKVVRAASPALLRIILLGAFFLYSTTLVLYPIPSMVTCSMRVWLREVGFSLSYGALMLKTWRISVIFRVRSAKAVKITDLDLMKRLGIIVGVFAVFLAIRTVVAPPQVIVSMTADDLKAFLCATDWWDHVFTAMEILFLIWGIRLCIMVRKAPSEFNESKFISMAIYNEFILSLFLNVSMLFLKSPADPDLLFIIFFCHTQLTITLLIALIFGSKVYLVLKGQGKGEDSMSMTKPMAAKFLQRSHAQNHLHTASSDNVDMQEEFRRVYLQLEALKDKYQRNGNRNMVLILTAMQQAANTSMAPGTPTPTPTPITAAVVAEKNGASQREVQKEERRGSKKERRCSDGVVMRPHVNNILASVTDKIVCATFQEELRSAVEGEALTKPPRPGGMGVGSGREACVLRRTKSKGAAADGRERRREDFFPNLEGVAALEGSMGRSLPATPCSPIPQQQDNLSVTSRGDKTKKQGSDQSNTAGSSLTSRSDSTPSDQSGPCRTPLQLGYRNAEFLLRKSVSSELTERVCRSLEYLDEGGGSRGPGSTPLGTEEDPSLEDRSVRSAHSTPRRSQGRRFREVRDPERARAFILYSLSDRATLTDEVTV